MPTRKMLAVTLVVTALTLLCTPTGASAAKGPVKLDRAPTGAEWDAGQVACFLQVTGQAANLEFETTPLECWLVEPGSRSTPWAARAGGGAAAASFTNVGYHYDGASFTGSFITVAGTVCNGGWLNLSWDWINRISSTDSPCWVGHYDGYNLTGSAEYLMFGNLWWVNNGANSLVYS